MQITLVQCPANNPDSPPYSLALLNAALKSAGHNPIIHDLNIELFQRARRLGVENVWSQGHSQEAPIEKWISKDFTSDKLAPHQDYINDFIEKIVADKSPVIGFTAHTSSFWSSIMIAEQVKKKAPNKTIVFGGAYCFLNHEGPFLLEKYDFIDIVCFLEAETSFPELLHKMEKGEPYFDQDGYGFRTDTGEVVNNYINTPHGKSILSDSFIKDLDTIPFADWSCFDFDNYQENYLPIITGRGCIRRCSFCNEAPVWGRFRTRTASNIEAEIIHQSQLYPHISVFWFMDSLVNGNLEMLSELCDRLIARETAGLSGKERGGGKFGWTGQFLIRPEMDEYMWEKISLAGGQWFACGLENGSNNVLKMMRKGYTRELVKKVIAAAHKVDPDLISVAMFVVGHPGETEDDFQDTLDMILFLKSLGISSSVSTCDVRRDSPLWLMKDKYGIIVPPDEEYFDGNPHKWYTKDGTNTPAYRESLLKRTMEVNATMLHTLKPGEKGLVEGSVNLHYQGAEIQDIAAKSMKGKNVLRILKDLIIKP